MQHRGDDISRVAFPAWYESWTWGHGDERTHPMAVAEVCSSRPSLSTRRAIKWQAPIAVQYHCPSLYYGYTKPGPVISCQTPSYQQKLSLQIYSSPVFTWTNSSHWEKPAQTSGKHILSATGTTFQLICKFFLSVLHPTGKVTGLCVRYGVMRSCLFWPEKVTYKVTTFSRLRLRVLVNLYPFGMVITVNQKRKNSQKEQFCLPSQQDLTHPPEKDSLKATVT